MRSKINYYILISKGEWERVSESLNKAVAAMSISVKELAEEWLRNALILRNDKFYKAICKANKYMEEQERLK